MTTFWKLQGGGNDFVAFDNRAGRVSVADMPRLAQTVCHRRFGVGADGAFWLSLSSHPAAAVRWDFYNSDGSRAEMCGNGSRCAGLLAVRLGFAQHQQPFFLETDRGLVRLTVASSSPPPSAKTTTTKTTTATVVCDEAEVRALLPAPSGLVLNAAADVHFVDTGVPHAVVVVPSVRALAAVRIREEALAVRAALPATMRSTNVNFAAVEDASRGVVSVRTFERGVEDETLACGTGSAAVAVVLRALGAVDRDLPSTRVQVAGGATIDVVSCDHGQQVEIVGPAVIVFQGTISLC